MTTNDNDCDNENDNSIVIRKWTSTSIEYDSTKSSYENTTTE